jgi:hypothetical protein
VAVGVNKLNEAEINGLESELEQTKRELAEAKQELQQLRLRTSFNPSGER